jgi:hypothetical protein
MDKMLATFVEIIVAIFQFIYTIISAIVESAAKGNAFSCILLVGILAPFAFAFLRLIAGQGRARPMRRPRIGGDESSRREPTSKGGRLLEIITKETPSICDRLRALVQVLRAATMTAARRSQTQSRSVLQESA